MKKWSNQNNEGGTGVGDGLSQRKTDGASPSKWMLINKRKPWSLRKRIIIACVSVLAAALLGLGVYAITLSVNPMGSFDNIIDQTSFPPGVSPTPQYSDGQLVTPSPTIDPLTALMQRSDFSILQHTVNILLIGVDYAPERADWTGKKAYHSDVMIVLAINTDTNEVNMISLPRDTYADIPGVEGIYKLNASIDCGGGWPTESGFQKVCDSASWMLGGIPIKYYYAVDMTAVKGLVDKIEGVDFDLDIDFDMQGRVYHKGSQHMDGQAVLDYLRVRKDEHIEESGQSGDLKRINRQKNMLVAIFNKLKQTGKLYNVPDIIDTFEGNLFTNVPIDQTAALAAYASNVDPANIKMHSMGGSQKNIFNWNFVITDQKKRVDLIREIYGDAAIQLYDIHQYTYMAMPAASMLWEEMQSEVVLDNSRPILDSVKSLLDADALLPDYPKPTDPGPGTTVSPDPNVSAEPTIAPTPSPTPIPSEGYRRYPSDSDAWKIYNRAEAAYAQMSSWNFDDTSSGNITAIQAVKDQLKADIQSLYTMFNIGSPKTDKKWEDFWHVIYGDDKKKVTPNQSLVSNEIPVDFN